mgnify:CR=1 FL=1
MRDFLGELASKMEALEMTRDVPIEIVIGGCSVSGIDGDGSKWSPKLGATKYNKDAFIVIRRIEDPAPRQTPDS